MRNIRILFFVLVLLHLKIPYTNAIESNKDDDSIFDNAAQQSTIATLGEPRNNQFFKVRSILQEIHESVKINQANLGVLKSSVSEILENDIDFVKSISGLRELLEFKIKDVNDIKLIVQILKSKQNELFGDIYNSIDGLMISSEKLAKDIIKNNELSLSNEEATHKLNLAFMKIEFEIENQEKTYDEQFLETQTSLGILEVRVTKLEDLYHALGQRLNGKLGDSIQFISLSMNAFDNNGLQTNYALQYERFFEFDSQNSTKNGKKIGWIKNTSALLEIGRFDWSFSSPFETIPNIEELSFEEDNSFSYIGMGLKYTSQLNFLNLNWAAGMLLGHSFDGMEDLFFLSPFVSINFIRETTSISIEARLHDFHEIHIQEREFVSVGDSIITNIQQSEQIASVGIKLAYRF